VDVKNMNCRTNSAMLHKTHATLRQIF